MNRKVTSCTTRCRFDASFDRFIILFAAAFAMLAWLTARRAAAASATPPHAHRPGERPVPGNASAEPGQTLRAAHVPPRQHRPGRDAKRATGNRRIVRLGSGKSGGNWPQPHWSSPQPPANGPARGSADAAATRPRWSPRSTGRAQRGQTEPCARRPPDRAPRQPARSASSRCFLHLILVVRGTGYPGGASKPSKAPSDRAGR